MAKIMFIVPYSKYYLNFSWDLIESLVHDGHSVTALAPDSVAEGTLSAVGVRFIQIPLKNTGLNPFYDILSIFHLARIIRNELPDIVSCYSIKPVLYGALAARTIRTTRVFLTVTGLGYVFTGFTWKQRLLTPLVNTWYRLAFQHCERVFFENPDDLHLFNRLGLIQQDKTTILNGSGVNLDKFAMNPKVRSKAPITFILVARIIKDKGIYEYIEAARILKIKYPHVSIQLLGPFDHNPTSISKAQVKEWMNEGVIRYLGETTDVRPYLRSSNVFVLPSYREGTPKSVLEAMAMGLPIVTTDTPGCRETVIHGRNGLLVPVKSSKALADAMEQFILNPYMIEIMGACSREIAEYKYDVFKVNALIKSTMQI
ncbi:glycosyltransferase [Paenibacillus sp. LMG 31456]|uniref:Glycosyltransferase n=1 Tax=Paenibacillus foliorum TaxID=2654974 RepID=A0A972JXH9_9BACL|nr:glycosyltransferase family 4 protein [Paenibacillus foliorum]NOU92484.1 glycosyltransferase [Paenibacillus foliorum]